MDASIFFVPVDNDSKLLAHIKQEAIAIVESQQSAEGKQRFILYYSALCSFIERADKDFTNGGEEYLNILFHSYEYIRDGLPLTPISIIEKDFIEIKDKPYLCHKRCSNLIWNKTPLNEKYAVVNDKAYNIFIKKVFDFKIHEVFEQNENLNQELLYISKGGVITGEYFSLPHIKLESYKNNKITIIPPITIPAVKIYFKDNKDKDNMIFAVDHREPKIKELVELYDVLIFEDEYIKNCKLNLRNCKSGNHSKKDFSVITFPKPELYKKGNYEAVEENDNVYLKSASGIIAKWKDGHLTIYYNKVRWKKINSVYWTWFTGYGLAYLKNVYNHGNNNITFVY